MLDHSTNCLNNYYNTTQFDKFNKNLYEFNHVNGEKIRVIPTEILGDGACGTVYKVKEYVENSLNQEDKKTKAFSKKRELLYGDNQGSKKKIKASDLAEIRTPLLVTKKNESEIQQRVRVFAMKTFDFEGDQEFSIGKTFDHPNIVKFFDYTASLDPKSEGGYLLMEYVRGTTLSKRLETPISLSEFLKWSRELLSAVGHCLQKNVLPVDMKDENIMIDQEGNLKLIDFNCYCPFEILENANDEELLPDDFNDSPELTEIMRGMANQCPFLLNNYVMKIIPNYIEQDDGMIDAFKSYLGEIKIWIEFVEQELSPQD